MQSQLDADVNDRGATEFVRVDRGEVNRNWEGIDTEPMAVNMTCCQLEGLFDGHGIGVL